MGALPVLLPFDMSARVQGILLGVGGGVMLAAASFSLLIPGTAAAMDLGYSETAAAGLMVAGAMLFAIIDEIIPDINQKALGQVVTLGVMVGFVVMMF